MILALLATLSFSSAPALGIGDPAPRLGYGEVLKGSPVRSFSTSKVTVVEFWATWCAPCIELMPHLSKLYQEYEDRSDFVSVSVMENEPQKLKPFVAGMGEKMAYPVVADKVVKGKGFMHARWLQAAKQDSIPVAFIVDKSSRIAWIGHPARLSTILPKVIDGTWDAKAYQAKFDADLKDAEATKRLVAEGFGRLMATPRTRSYAATLRWIDRNRSGYDGPDTLAALDACRALFRAFLRADYEGALKLSEATPRSSFVWTYLRPMLLVARVDALQRLGRDWKGPVRGVINGPPDPNMLMNLVDALTLPDGQLLETDAALALAAAEKLTNMARAPLFLRRLAWAQYVSGDSARALATIDEALAAMPEEKRRNPQFYEGTLAGLKQAKAHFSRRAFATN